MFLVACGQQDSPLQVDAVLYNVSILDVRDGSTLENTAIVVADGRIHEMVSEDRIQDYAASTVVDGRGNFVIPSLADVHVHIQTPTELKNFVRYGVGLVVNMAGGPQHLEMREAVASKGLLGPSLVTAGPTLDGRPPTNPLFVTATPENADEIVDWIEENGYDAVKVYQQLDADTLQAVLQAAKKRGLITTGHISREIGIETSIHAGQRFVAHGEELAFESFDESSRTYDLTATPAIADQLSRAGVTVTPMLAYLENIPRQVSDLQSYLDSEEMRLTPVATRMSFDRRQGWFSNREDPEGFNGQIESLVSFVRSLTSELHLRGVPLVLGTDAGFGGAIPGFSVHEELQALVDAGLSEIAALQTATLKVGEYLMQIDPTRTPWGQVRPGFTASLVLLGTNPLENIAATQDIHGVMVAGRWLDQSELRTLQEDLVRRQQALLPIGRAFEEALIAGDLDAGRAAMESIPAEMAGEPLISADNCIFLGYRHYYGGRRPLAGDLYELCATMHPKSAPLWIHMARALESAEKPEAALRAYTRAHALNPWYGEPRAAMDRLSESLPQSAEAIGAEAIGAQTVSPSPR